MQTNVFIKEKLSGQHESFLRYCQEAGKKLVAELAGEDFIAYRAEYSVPREYVEQIKTLLNFQEQKSGEKISPSRNSEEILQDYFKIDDLAPYENILISELDFNVRVHNCLRLNDYRTLAELLKSSRQKLSGLKNFGQCSFDNLIATLKKFFDSRRKNLLAKTLQLANEELDEFLRNEALNHIPQVDLKISAFKKFSDSVTIKSLFQNLPEEFRDKRVQPFLLACGLEKNNLFIDLPDDLTLAEFPEYLAENSIDLDIDELKNFINVLRFDVRVCAKQILASLFNGERKFNIMYRRAKGDTLEEIGKNFGITRERVRQIESTSVSKFNKYRSDVNKIFYFLHALTDGKSLLTLDDAKNFLNTSDAEIFWFFAAKTNLSNGVFHFDEELNAVVFADENELDENELIKNLPEIIEEKFFEVTITNLAREKNYPVDLIKIKLAKIYKRNGKFFHRRNLTLTIKYGYILKERFPNGYKIADKTIYSRFIRYLHEIFNEEALPTQRSVDAVIATIAVLCDRGKYIHPDFVHISPEIIERVKKFIDSSDRTAIFYKEIFEALKNIFAGTQITNHYFLQGVIKFYNLPYKLRKDYLTKSNEIDMGKEFDNFVAERGEVSAQEIKRKFISFTDANINFLLLRCPEIIRIGDGNFLHATNLNLQAEDFESIKNFLRLNCSTPVCSRVLFELFFERFGDFMTRNEIQSHNKLFGVLQYMFRDEFNFSRPYISTEDIKHVSNKKILLRILEEIDEIEIEDLIGICKENGIHYVAKNYLIDSLRPDFIRVDEFTLVRPESIGVTDEIISAVVESIRSAIERNGGWQTVQTFADYEWLPQLEISWNSFLLESIATLTQDALYKIKVPSKSTNFSSTIFLSEEFAEDDFQSFLTKILIVEHNKEPFRTEKEIFDWLKTQGLCNKKLPKFLEGGRAFEILGE
ncbi:MAG: hypothetical protein IJS81_10830 [Selenomonadaceae bacterium]|nr:hypothetical protein [Selenomonadaceae bacterium]MBQ7630685.1 hypothetical protein [Selenomonadaceae bacterium]